MARTSSRCLPALRVSLVKGDMLPTRTPSRRIVMPSGGKKRYCIRLGPSSVSPSLSMVPSPSLSTPSPWGKERAWPNSWPVNLSIPYWIVWRRCFLRLTELHS